MGKNISDMSGDGSNAPLVSFNLNLPDTNGGNAVCEGTVSFIGLATVKIVNTPLALPVAPGAGQVFYMLQVNTSTGVVSLKQSTASYPTADAGNLLIYQETLGTTDTNPSNVAISSSPDEW